MFFMNVSRVQSFHVCCGVSSEYRRIKRFVIRRRTLRCNWSGGKVEQLFGHGQLKSLQESLECVMCRLQKRVEMLGQIPDICYQHVSCFYSCHAPFIKQFKRCNEFHLTSSAGFMSFISFASFDFNQRKRKSSV